MQYGKVLLFIMLSLLAYSGKGQQVKLHTEYYASDSAQVYCRGYDSCYKEGFLKRRLTCTPVGVWEFFHDNGNKASDVDMTERGYVNVWLNDGRQILANGTGVRLKVRSYRHHTDSMVYQLKNYIQSGQYTRFRSYEEGPYFIVETGHYENDTPAGIWIFRDSVQELHEIKNKNTGYVQRFFLNTGYREEGFEFNNKKEGNWKTYDKAGKLHEECGYRAGLKFGRYAYYYTNGLIKQTGTYVRLKRKGVNYLALDGEWKSFAEDGRLIKRVKHYRKQNLYLTL